MNQTTDIKQQDPIVSLRTGDLITRAWAILKKSLGQVAGITVFGMILPQIAFTWILAHKADAVFEEIKNFTMAGKSDSNLQVFHLAFEATIRFFSIYGAAALFLWLVMLTSYTGIVQLSLDRLQRKRPRSTFALVRVGLKTTLLRSLWATLFAGLILGFSQVFPPIAVVIAVLSTLIPVLAVAEQGGPLRILWRSLSLRFAPKSQLGRWPVFFAMLSLGGVFYLSEFGLTLLVEYANSFDESLLLPSAMVSRALPYLPFTPIYAMADLVDSIIGVSLLPMLAAATSVLYMRVINLTDAHISPHLGVTTPSASEGGTTA